MWLLGLLDDRRHVRPMLRLVLSAGACWLTISFVPDLQVTFFHFGFLSHAMFLDGGWGILFTLLCLVGLQNALNMADGKNGLALGLLLIWTCLIAVYSPAHLLPLLLALAVCL